MSDERGRLIPADMLLLAERRRRLQQARIEARIAPANQMDGDAEAGLGEDQLIAETLQKSEPPAATGAGAAVEPDKHALFFPLAEVILSGVSRRDAIDHGALQAAIACSTRPPGPGPALHVSLGDDELSALKLAARRAPDATLRLQAAAVLPVTIIGVESYLAAAAVPALVAYRRSALLHAWHETLGSLPPPNLARERDVAGVRLLSTLGALIGDV